MDAFGRVILWGIVVGVIGMFGGILGPMLLTPESNQGPLLGIFFTGPAGFVVGILVGLVRETAPFAKSNRHGHCIKCGYDLRGAEHEVCPECGVETTTEVVE